MRIIELIIDEDAELFGIDGISLVDKPAIESDWVALSDQRVEFVQVGDKRVLVGAALIPDKPIYRKKDEDEFYVYFSKKTVRKAMELFMRDGHTGSTTLQHQHKLSGLHVMESWIVEDVQNDKSSLYGLKVPVGTWMVAIKVNNEAVWDDYVKTGIVRGFSIEGYFANRMEAEMRQTELCDALSDVLCVELEGGHNDYPESVKKNAKTGILLNERNNNKCATQVGKVRAQQLAQGKTISSETVRRMYSYLSRAEEYYDPKDRNSCGYISYMLWGGKSALSWARAKVKELDAIKAVKQAVKEHTESNR